MKSLKINFLVILMFALFGCNTQQISDEAPIDIKSRAGGNPPANTSGQRPAVMAVSVMYSDLRDRALFRANFETYSDIVTWYTCPTNPSVEVWEVPHMSEAAFNVIVSNLGIFTVVPPGSVGSAGGIDAYSGANMLSFEPIFFFDKICW